MVLVRLPLRVKPKHVVLQRDDPLIDRLFIAIPFDDRYFINPADSDVVTTEWENISDIGVRSNDVVSGDHPIHAALFRNPSALSGGDWTFTEYGRAWDHPNQSGVGLTFTGLLTQSAGVNSDHPPMTFSVHCGFGSNAADRTIVDWGSGGSAILRHVTAPDVLQISGIGDTLQSSGSFMGDGLIHHIVAVVSPGRQELWVDGFLEDTGTGNGFAQSGTQNFITLFHDNSQGDQLNAPVVDFRVWDRVLEPWEINELWSDPWRMYRPRPIVVGASGAALVRVVNETEQVSETTEQHRAITQAVDEIVEIVETTGRALVMTRIVDDIVQLVETTARPRIMARTVDDLIQVLEAVEQHRAISQTVDEVVSVVEQTLRSRAMTRVVDEAVSIVEQTLRARAMTRIVSEVVEIPETAFRIGAIGPPVNVDVVLANLNVDVILGT